MQMRPLAQCLEPIAWAVASHKRKCRPLERSTWCFSSTSVCMQIALVDCKLQLGQLLSSFVARAAASLRYGAQSYEYWYTG